MTQTMTIRLPDEVHEKLREEAFTTRMPMNRIIVERLRIEATPEVYGLLCNLFEAAWHHHVPQSLYDMPPMTSNEARTLANLAIEAVGVSVSP